tara:strand:- start:657 stop:1298 length:642 start_codon:yes stop_codon:yes gene_type:complete
MPRGLVKAAIKRGRRSRRGRPSNKVKELMESRDISRAEAEKLAKKKTSSKKKPVKKKTAKKKAEPKRTKREQKELEDLVEQQEQDMKGAGAYETPRAGATPEERLSINAPARSKEKPPKRKDLSSAQLRRLVTSGLVGVGEKGQVTDKGTYSSGANVGQRMMRGDVGGDTNMKALEDELRTIGGFEGLKSGGKVGIGRGCGVAMRGAGAVRKS